MELWGRRRASKDTLLRRTTLESQLQLELGCAGTALVEGARATLRAVCIERRVVVRTRDVAGDRVGGSARRVHVEQRSGEAGEVGEVEDVVERHTRGHAQTFTDPCQADRV